ncbi:MAG: AMP-binding protein [Polyangiaceae bacterium]|nr:AMP-binding protein [Polyangiaceae bacterium]MBK8937649.1 AMP-binding protein [Polyangiaceae bacterium]
MIGWFLDRMDEAPTREALVWRERAVTYGELRRTVRIAAERLRKAGVTTGSVVSLEGDYSPGAVALLLALVDAGAIVVPLTASVEQSKPDFRRIAEVGFVVRLSEDDAWTIEPTGIQATHPLIQALRDRGHPGIIVFSSGSTGFPKAAIHDFVPLFEKFKPRRHSLRTLTFLLLDHLGGINTLLYILSNLGTVVTVARRDPDSVCEAIARHRVELLPTSPTFLNLMLLSEAHTRHDLSSLVQVSYGTEPMPESTLRRVHEIFPNVKLLQTYGLSELGVLRSKSKSSDSLWVKVGGEGFETKVHGGTLWIRAQSSILGYLNAPSPFDAEGWMDTGDEVLVDGEYLRFLGRRSEIINVGGEKVYPAEVESILLEMDGILDAAVRGEKNPITGMMVVARLTVADSSDAANLRVRVRAFCKDRLSPFKVPAKVEVTVDPLHSGRFKRLRRGD